MMQSCKVRVSEAAQRSRNPRIMEIGGRGRAPHHAGLLINAA